MRNEYKRIPGYENYVVTSDGKVLRIFNHHMKELKPFVEYGYALVCLRKSDGTQKKFRVHRLVAEAFISNPDNKPQVNHIDENKLNNNISNLEWCTAKENTNYGTRNDKISRKLSKRVKAINPLTNNIIYHFNSMREASEVIPKAKVSHIGQCCKGIRKTAGGYAWEYE